METEIDSTSTDADAAQQIPGTHLVTLYPTAIQVPVRDGETIVDALRRQGLRTRYKCRRGGCGACRATVLSGELTYSATVCQDVVNGTEDAQEQGNRVRCLPCRAVPCGDVDLLLDPSDDVIDVLGAVLPTAAVRTPAAGSARGSYEGSNPCPS